MQHGSVKDLNFILYIILLEVEIEISKKVTNKITIPNHLLNVFSQMQYKLTHSHIHMYVNPMNACTHSSFFKGASQEILKSTKSP